MQPGLRPLPFGSAADALSFYRRQLSAVQSGSTIPVYPLAMRSDADCAGAGAAAQWDRGRNVPSMHEHDAQSMSVPVTWAPRRRGSEPQATRQGRACTSLSRRTVGSFWDD